VALDLKVALGLFPVTVIPMMLVGGLFLNVDNIPYYFIWLQYISYVFYAFVARKLLFLRYFIYFY